MTITSVSFLLFLLLSVLAFYLCPVKHRWIVLLVSSVCFYLVAGGVQFLPFIVFTSLVVWLCGRQIGRLYQQQDGDLKEAGADRAAKKKIKETYKKKARRILLLALVLCVGILCVTKFTKYAVRYLNLIAGALNGTAPFSAAWVLVPLGISYYTFSTVGYLLDVYWRRYGYEENFFRFFLYAIYFPHIVQGPISRYNLLGQELKKELRFDEQRVVFGVELMIWGFFKKMVIADRLNLFVSSVYDGQVHPGSIFLLAALFDAIQIYTDFSGYMDIVRGASQIFGVELENNFNHPFFSRTVPEFWRRWHMTLGGWFKDYVYYPCTISHWMKKLNKTTKKRLPERVSRFFTVVIPVMITWVLTGLWHGTGKTYLCWGIYYGALITISVAFQPEFARLTKLLRIRTDTLTWRTFQMVRTFCCFMGGRLLTSPGSLRNTWMVLREMVGNFQPWCLLDGSVLAYGVNGADLILLAFCVLLLWAVSMLQERCSVRQTLARQNIVLRWALLYVAIFSVVIFGIYGPGFEASAFIYMQY